MFILFWVFSFLVAISVLWIGGSVLIWRIIEDSRGDYLLTWKHRLCIGLGPITVIIAIPIVFVIAVICLVYWVCTGESLLWYFEYHFGLLPPEENRTSSTISISSETLEYKETEE